MTYIKPKPLSKQNLSRIDFSDTEIMQMKEFGRGRLGAIMLHLVDGESIQDCLIKAYWQGFMDCEQVTRNTDGN